MILRWALGITFLWFGILKLFNVSPVMQIIQNAMPDILSRSQLFFFVLAIIEIVIGVAFLINRYTKIAVVVMILHLIVATVSVLVTQGFDPRFPVLSIAGEFVIKNLVLISAGLILWHNTTSKGNI